MHANLHIATAAAIALTAGVEAAVITVGPGKDRGTIGDACSAAAAGDTILVYPLAGAAAYDRSAVLLRKKLTIVGTTADGTRVAIDGAGFDYSGEGSVPRAAFQFSPGSDGSVVENLDISGCHNGSHNGAAFRINQTNDVTIRNCHIHGNDMGIMSNGRVADGSAARQLIENCHIHDNGDLADPGYNHNLYLGGTSVTVRGCDIHSATTGHNVKSRAHINVIEACFVHDSPNREFDLVDEAGNTNAGGSHSLIRGCVVRKHPNCTGNKTTIHFGQDGSADHNGTLYIVHSTILTQYQSPVVDLSSQNAGVAFYNALVLNPTGGGGGQTLVGAGRNGATLNNSSGQGNWVSAGFSFPAQGQYSSNTIGSIGANPSFVNESLVDYTPAEKYAGVVDAGVALASLNLPVLPGAVAMLLRFAYPLGSTERGSDGAADIGAFERGGVQVRTPLPDRVNCRQVAKDSPVRYDLSGRPGEGRPLSRHVWVDPLAGTTASQMW